MEDKYVGIDIGGTGIKYALMTQSGQILEQGEVPTPHTNLDDYIQTLVGIYRLYENENPKAIVSAAPGRIDAQTGYFYTGGALQYILNINLKELIEKEIPIPITFENDAKAAAQAELWKGSMQGVKNGIVMTLGTGIGGAIIIDGKLYRGSTHAAGEFSIIPVEWNKAGEMNIWANAANTHALTDRLAVKKGVDPADFSGRDFFTHHANGDVEAQECLDAFCEQALRGLYGLQAILDVDKVAIGGGISRQPALIETFNRKNEELFNNLPPYFAASRPEICACQFTNDANLIGALYHHLDLTGQL